MKNWPLEKLFSVASVIVFVAATTAAALLKPEFVFLQDYLSELGREGLSAAFFNSGLAVSAVFIALFFAALARNEKNNLIFLLAPLAGIASAIALAGAAVFPVQAEPGHSRAVYAFFSLAALSTIACSATSLYSRKQKNYLPFSIAALHLALTILLAIYKTALLQALTIAVFGAWMLAKAFPDLREQN